MSEISNKTLVGLLVVAIVISLAGTFISLNKLGQLGVIGLQGANVTSQQGTTWAQTLGTAQITLYNNGMNFTIGQVNGTYSTGHDFCGLESDGVLTAGGNDFSGSSLGNGAISSACDGFTIPSSFVIENTGNVQFTNVTMATASGLSNFKSTFTSSVTNGTWTYRFSDEEASGTNSACTENYAATYTSVGDTILKVCSSFQATPATDDAFVIQMNITIPEDAPAAIWTDTVTFVGNV